VNAKIEKRIEKTLRKSSPARAWAILFFCACIVVLAILLRFFVFSVWNFEDKMVFVCELAPCKEKSKEGDLLLVTAWNGNSVLLWQIGKSGDSVKIPTPFDTLSVVIPQAGDTIIMETLSPMLWDASYILYKRLSPEKEVKTEVSLWSSEREMPFSYVGRASISGRPVSEREVVFLPWQELRILELQLQKIFPAVDGLHFKRKLFADSAEVENFVVNDELFYLSCEKPEQPKLCYDSRENGFFRKSDLKGTVFFTSSRPSFF